MPSTPAHKIAPQIIPFFAPKQHSPTRKERAFVSRHRIHSTSAKQNFHLAI
jgi:hypothetical protein